MTHPPIDGVVVGKHPLVVRLMKGVFNGRPPQPRYGCTWDVKRVLEHIKSLGDNRVLSLKQLSSKLAVLLALANASRASDIHALDLRFMTKKEGRVTFQLAELTKTARPGKRKQLSYRPLEGEKHLCPVVTLADYVQRTGPFRRNESQLFLSVVKPFKPVTKATIARWVKTVIQEAGVGTQYGAHSTRSAAATAAHMKGMSMRDIMDIADWSSDSTFKTFYLKPIESGPHSLFNSITE